MLIIGSLEKLYKAQPELIDNMYLYKHLIYKRPIKLHTDRWDSEYHRVVKCLTNVEFFYHDRVYHVNAGDYVLFNCQVLHGNKSDTKYARTDYNIVDTSSKNEQVVVFHVNTWVNGAGKLKQDESKQRLRAYALCDYMNRTEDYIDNFDGKLE